MMLPSGMPGARVMIILGYPSVDDVRNGTVGKDSIAWELEKMLQEAGFHINQCYLTCALKERPKADDIVFIKKDITPEHVEFMGKWVRPGIQSAAHTLHREIEMVAPKIIITLGDLPTWLLTGKWGTKKWRGSQLVTHSGTKLIPTYSPKDIFAQWELRTIAVQDIRAAVHYIDRDFPPVNWHFIIRPTFEAAMDTINFLLEAVGRGSTPIAYDIETLAGNLSCLSLAWSKNDAICIPFMKMGKPEGYYTEAEEAEIVYALYSLMTHPNFQGITQNGLFDSQYIYRKWHFIPRHYQDTMLSHHVLYSGMQKSLDFICSFHNEQYVYWKDDLKEWRTTIVADETQYWNYSCEDSARTWEAANDLQNCVDQVGIREQHDFQQGMFMPVLRMMNTGVRFDYELMKQMRIDLEREAARLEKDIAYIVGWDLNPRSPKQMQAFFYEEMGQPKQTNRTKAGISVTCDSAALAKIALRQPLLKPLISIIEEWRSAQVYLSSYLTDTRDVDGRMRCSYNIAGTITFRFSSSANAFNSGYNLQTVPKGEED
jgi:uracil-DNA glycosylase